MSILFGHRTVHTGLNGSTGGGDQAPPGYSFFVIGSPGSYQNFQFGDNASAPRLAISTGA